MATQQLPARPADYLRPSEFAAACGVTPETVRNWIKAGLIEAYRLGGGPSRAGRFRIPRSELDRVIKPFEGAQ